MLAPILLLQNDIPDPWSPSVDLFQAFADFDRDEALHHWVLANNPGLEDLCRVWCRQFDWSCFWAARHPNEEVRELLAASVEADQEEAKSIVALTERLISKQTGEMG
jgi:hypothetical protein